MVWGVLEAGMQRLGVKEWSFAHSRVERSEDKKVIEIIGHHRDFYTSQSHRKDGHTCLTGFPPGIFPRISWLRGHFNLITYITNAPKAQ